MNPNETNSCTGKKKFILIALIVIVLAIVAISWAYNRGANMINEETASVGDTFGDGTETTVKTSVDLDKVEKELASPTADLSAEFAAYDAS